MNDLLLGIPAILTALIFAFIVAFIVAAIVAAIVGIFGAGASPALGLSDCVDCNARTWLR